jgi:hypothetical protein
MSKSNGRSDPDLLLHSGPDCVMLARTVCVKVQELIQFHRAACGMDPVAPVELKQDFVRWRTLLDRHNAGDRRHTMSELKATRAVAQWAVDMNMAIRNQPPKTIEWRS